MDLVFDLLLPAGVHKQAIGLSRLFLYQDVPGFLQIISAYVCCRRIQLATAQDWEAILGAGLVPEDLPHQRVLGLDWRPDAAGVVL